MLCAHREVVAPAGEIEVAKTAAGGRVFDDDNVPGLRVGAAGRESRRVENARQYLVADRRVGELAHGAGAAQRVDQVHEFLVSLQLHGTLVLTRGP